MALLALLKYFIPVPIIVAPWESALIKTPAGKNVKEKNVDFKKVSLHTNRPV